jgi:ribosomal protein S26
MKKEYKQCQSCGMPLKKDKKGGGSEKDGTISKIYCSSCYDNGEFKRPHITVQEMQNLVDEVLRKEMKWWKIFRRLAIAQIPSLERRKKNK